MSVAAPSLIGIVYLHVGVEAGGARHDLVELAPLTVADWFALAEGRTAVEKAPAEEKSVALYTFGLEALARRIRRFGDVPRRDITPAWLRERLALPDLELLLAECARLDVCAERFRDARAAALDARDRGGDANRVEPS